MLFHLPTLPWGRAALEPFLSAETIDAHYYGHHKGYIEKLNKAVQKLGLKEISLEKIILNYDGEVFNNGAQAWNHAFFWLGLSPQANPLLADDPFLEAVNQQYGSLDEMRAQFFECGANLFGSGWTWVVADNNGKLDILNTHNADNPIRFEQSRPLWACDVWEHAYYIDYRNERKEYLTGAWKHVNWQFVSENFANPQFPNMTRLMLNPTATEVTSQFM